MSPVEVLAVMVTGYGVFVSSMQFLQIHKLYVHKISDNISIPWLLSYGFGGVLWGTYGAMISSLPLMITSFYGAFVTGLNVTMVIYYRRTHPKR